MNETVQALFFAIGYLNITIPSEEVVIIGNYDAAYTRHFPKAKFNTPFAGQSALWKRAGHTPYEGQGAPHLTLVSLPQQSHEADAVLAIALSQSADNGLVMAVADNQSGGKTLGKRMAAFGCPVQDLSKHKCRVAWTTQPQQSNPALIKIARDNGMMQVRTSDGLYTQPGIFSWEHRDAGTSVLLHHLPQNLTGHGTDFGTGLGEIARSILQDNPGILSLTCIEHDQRALTCCQHNVSAFQQKTEFLWEDIPQQTTISGLDFVVMNPPFHQGKTEDKDLGKAFIAKAAAALKPKGKLYMVANTHLPYEEDLRTLFSGVDVLGIEKGFKVILATR